MRLGLHNFHLFTHAGCMDGSASAILFQHAGGDEKNISYIPAGMLDEAIADHPAVKDPNKQLLFVDIAPTKDETADFLVRRGNAFVIDHHVTAARFAGLPGFYIDVNNNACGCENFRQWLVRGGMTRFDAPHYRRFTAVVDDHDRWKLQIPFSIEIPRFFSFIGQQEFTKRFMNVQERFGQEKEKYWSPFEQDMMDILEREQARRFHSVLKRFQVFEQDVNGARVKVGYVISGEINCSELLNLYLEKNPGVDIACQINMDLNKVSLRTKGGVNVSTWAQKFGGGGHKSASGHGLPDDLVRKVVELIHG